MYKKGFAATTPRAQFSVVSEAVFRARTCIARRGWARMRGGGGYEVGIGDIG
jgi:hypothetical protein